jgi:iron complex transport system substrate-binding protein
MSANSSRLKLRIAVLQPSLSIVIDRLGCLDSVVACTRYCLEAVPALRGRDVRVIADSWSSTTEEILSASPNLVLASVPYRLESLAAILKSGCPVVTLAPHSLSDIYDDFRIIGALLHATGSAEKIVEEMQSTIEAVQKKAAQAQTRPLVYCEEWGKPLIHSQAWVSELVSAAGGNFLGKPGAVTEAEVVALADPDVLVFAWCGAGDRVPLERVIEKRQWRRLRAVQSGRVYCIPDELLNTPATNLLDGLQALASGIHPEIFGKGQNLRTLAAMSA